MPNVYVARQPICDRNLQVVGYELLFRGGEAVATAGVGVADDDAATRWTPSSRRSCDG